LSGAGPTIMVLSTEDLPAEIVDTASSEGLRVLTLPIAGPIQVNRKELG
jgi:homoserine kinase